MTHNTQTASQKHQYPCQILSSRVSSITGYVSVYTPSTWEAIKVIFHASSCSLWQRQDIHLSLDELEICPDVLQVIRGTQD